jgi:hypothetical protein
MVGGVLTIGILAFSGDIRCQEYFGGAYINNSASTPAESYARGMSDVVRSAGEYNLATSAAAINMTQAAQQDMENRRQWTDTYFDMRKANREHRAAERGNRPSMESLVRYAQAGKPRPLSPNEVDFVTGRVNWPSALKVDGFDKERQSMEQLLARRAENGGLGSNDQVAVRETTDAMLTQLKAAIRDMAPTDYTAAKRFLESLAYEAQRI